MKINAERVEEAEFALYGRIFRCPLGGNPEDCPMHELRKLPVGERIAWVESKTDAEMIALYEHHNNCLKRKLEESES